MLTGRPGLLAALSAFALIVGFYLSLTTGHGSWFSRSGALIVILGAVQASGRVFSHESSLRYSLERVFTRDGLNSEKVSLILIIVGTMVWAFGDLVVYLIPPSS